MRRVDGGSFDEAVEQLIREAFDTLLGQARLRADPADWPRFRGVVHEALVATFGLGAVRTDLAADVQARRCADRHRRADGMIDLARSGFDPAVDWDGFVEELWAARDLVLRPDPAQEPG